MKLTRGQKLCSLCNCVNAARQRVCKKCKNSFDAKNIPIKSEVIEWSQLKRGEFIKIIIGTGPYFLTKKETEFSQAGEKICMGDNGVFIVDKIDDNGIHVYGATNQNGGYSFLYMGTPYQSEATGLYYEKYRIKKVKRRV